MAENEKLIPTWGYHASQEPQIFHLTQGQKLPDGWHDHPDKAKAEQASSAAKQAAQGKATGGAASDDGAKP